MEGQSACGQDTMICQCRLSTEQTDNLTGYLMWIVDEDLQADMVAGVAVLALHTSLYLPEYMLSDECPLLLLVLCLVHKSGLLCCSFERFYVTWPHVHARSVLLVSCVPTVRKQIPVAWDFP